MTERRALAPQRQGLLHLLLERQRIQVEAVVEQPEVGAYLLDLSKHLYLAGADEIVYLEVAGSLTGEKRLETLRSIVEEYGWRDQIKIVFLPQDDPHLAEALREGFGNLVVLWRSQLDGSEDAPIRLLKKVLVSSVDREFLVLYKYFGAVTGNRFFGREHQLAAIRNSPLNSYLVTGTRMSGKSSLMLEARRQIDPSARFGGARRSPLSVYVDCKRYGTFAGMINAILLELSDRGSFSNLEKWMNPQRWPEFFRYLRSYARTSAAKRLHLFLDEYDRVIDWDEQENARITWNFRELHQSNSAERSIIQFVIGGSKRLASLSNNQESALHNFVNYTECRLGNFDVGTVRQVIVGPFEDLGFELDDPQRIATEMLSETAGRPSSVQYVCGHAVRRLIARKEAVLTADTVRAVTQSPDYLQFYKDALFENTDPLDQFILCLESRPEQGQGRSFTDEDIQKACEQLKIYVEPSLLSGSLSNLVNSGFLKHDEESWQDLRYEIATPVIRRIFKTQSPEWYVRLMKEKKLASSFT